MVHFTDGTREKMANICLTFAGMRTSGGGRVMLEEDLVHILWRWKFMEHR